MSTTCAPTVKAVVSWLNPASKLSGSAARMTSSAVFSRYWLTLAPPDEQVAVGEHHALRLAGAAGGVEDRGHVDVDPTRGSTSRGVAPGDALAPLVAEHDHAARPPCTGSSSRRSSRRSAEVTSTRTLAVGEDVRHLLGLAGPG